jgi:adenosylhomocysteine nucleosidase
MLAFLAALGIEAACLTRQMRVERVSRGPTWRTYLGTVGDREILLVQTGMGRMRAEPATRSLLEMYDVDAVISFGFGGALRDDLDAGDLVLASALYAVGESFPAEPIAEASSVDDRLRTQAGQLLEDAGVAWTTGAFVTMTKLVTDSEEKRKLGEAYRAAIVDMESSWIAHIASRKTVPFVALRAVSDTLQEGILPFEHLMTSSGTWKWRETVTFFLRRPGRVKGLFHLAANARRARRCLSVALRRLVDGLSVEEG